MDLNLADLRKANVERCEEVFHPLTQWSPTDYGCAMAGEAGEACNKLKKLKRLADSVIQKMVWWADKSLTDEIVAMTSSIGEELADTVIYCDLIAARLNIDLAKAIIDKFNADSEKHNSTKFLKETPEGKTFQMPDLIGCTKEAATKTIVDEAEVLFCGGTAEQEWTPCMSRNGLLPCHEVSNGRVGPQKMASVWDVDGARHTVTVASDFLVSLRGCYFVPVKISTSYHDQYLIELPADLEDYQKPSFIWVYKSSVMLCEG